MKSALIIILLISSLTVYGFETDSSISFINATKSDNEIILCKILSYPNYDSTKSFCPKIMLVEVLEVLKGTDSLKIISIEGDEDFSYHNLACLKLYSIGSSYVLGLDNHKLNINGRHSLDYSNNSVKGIISKEPSIKFINKANKVFVKLQKEKYSKHRDREKIKALSDDFFAIWDTQDELMNFEEFKKKLLISLEH